MNSRAPRLRTIFWLAGDGLDPNEFSRLLTIQPTKSGRKGELVANPKVAKLGRTNPETHWEIDDERGSYSMDEGIQEVLGRIWPHREAIARYVRARPGVKMGFIVVIRMYEDRPVYEISMDSIRKLADLGCDFAIDDIYEISEA